MAKKPTDVADDTAAVTTAAPTVTGGSAADVAAASDAAVADPAPVAAASDAAVADPAPADAIDGASGAVIEPAIVAAIDMTHPAIDANPRAGTVALQNARDMNDPLNRLPDDPDFVGQGLDASVYGDKAR